MINIIENSVGMVLIAQADNFHLYGMQMCTYLKIYAAQLASHS